jgi:hypothetical protein
MAWHVSATFSRHASRIFGREVDIAFAVDGGIIQPESAQGHGDTGGWP